MNITEPSEWPLLFSRFRELFYSANVDLVCILLKLDPFLYFACPVQRNKPKTISGIRK